MKIIFYILILSICFACSRTSKQIINNSKSVNNEKYIRYDTNKVVMEVYFYPENFEDELNYTYSSTYFKTHKLDTCKHTFFNDSSYKKNMIYHLNDNLVIQELYKEGNILSKGNYHLNSEIKLSKELLYDDKGNETDTIIVIQYQEAYRNGKWEYFENEVKQKVEIWNMGIIDTTVIYNK